MRLSRFALAASAVTAVVATVVACSSDPDPPAKKAPFGCCEEAAPPRCTRIAFGRAKRTADDTCIDARDGAIPDPNAPGWTQEVDADGCKKWVPAPGTKTIACGGADGGLDGGADAPADAPFDAPPTPGLYVAICRTVVGASDANDLRFWVDAAVASPASDAGGGEAGADSSITLIITPLIGWKAGAPTPPATVTASLKLGAPVTATSPVAANKVYRASFGAATLLADANSISGRELVFSELTLDGTFSGLGKGFCGQLSAKLTQPVALELKGDQNTCLFFPTSEGAPLPEPAPADFVCALP